MFSCVILFISAHNYGEQQKPHKETKTFHNKRLMLTTFEQMQNISLTCSMETVCLGNKGPHESLKEDSVQAAEAQREGNTPRAQCGTETSNPVIRRKKSWEG